MPYKDPAIRRARDVERKRLKRAAVRGVDVHPDRPTGLMALPKETAVALASKLLARLGRVADDVDALAPKDPSELAMARWQLEKARTLVSALSVGLNGLNTHVLATRIEDLESVLSQEQEPTP